MTTVHRTTVRGHCSVAEIFASDVEPYTIAQVRMICDIKELACSGIRLMPDAHPGKIGPIGLTMTVDRCVLPGLVGFDIGCGVTLAQIKAKRIEFQKLDAVIRDCVPAGFNVRKHPHRLAKEFDLDDLRCAPSIRQDKALCSLGTLGGGNHFIEVDRDDDGGFYVAVHSGSRHLGKEVAERYMRLGKEALKDKGVERPYELTYLEGALLEDYLHDQAIVCKYASVSRRAMIAELARGMKWKVGDVIESTHNCIDVTGPQPILRKGAVSAKDGETALIPINMRDGIIVGRGLGNEDWNCSAPHGAGRLYRRDEVKNHFTVSDFKASMKGIYSPSINAGTLDEAPFAYRDIETIQNAIGETGEIERILKPIYNFKAGGE